VRGVALRFWSVGVKVFGGGCGGSFGGEGKKFMVQCWTSSMLNVDLNKDQG
jgi:hypothetical protein